MKRISPTNSYSLDLPDDIITDSDDHVFSWWQDNSEILLQLSSYKRNPGLQVTASERLGTRRKQTEFRLDDVAPHLSTDCPDIASASGIDSEGLKWHYYYLVWPDLAIFATVSGKPANLLSQGSWTMSALNSLKRTE